MSEKTKNIGIIFFGKKGGGSRMLLDTLSIDNLCTKYSYTVYINSKNNLKKDITKQILLLAKKDLKIDLKEKSFSLINLYLQMGQQQEKFDSNITNIFLMSSHRDWPIWKKISANKRVLLIHDFKSHMGDLYPFPWTIRTRIWGGGNFFCLSRFVSDQVAAKMSIVPSVVPFPFLESINSSFPNANRILVLGRMRKYQGLRRLKKIDEELKKYVREDVHWVIAGAGKIRKNWLPENTEIINRWLTESEIENLIKLSSLQLLPYSEATQSGAVLYANKFGKPVVVTPVGGLLEQVTNFENGIISKTTDEADIAEAINSCLNFSWKFKDKPRPKTKFISNFLVMGDN
jgi:glycosyltransferase involved in cell wall biosynthesis